MSTRLGFATSLPAFVYGSGAGGNACADVSRTYMRCLDRRGANVLIQADANDGPWTGPDGSDAAERWQPLSWMGSAWRAVSDPNVHFAYATNAMLVGNLADTPVRRSERHPRARPPRHGLPLRRQRRVRAQRGRPHAARQRGRQASILGPRPLGHAWPTGVVARRWRLAGSRQQALPLCAAGVDRRPSVSSRPGPPGVRRGRTLTREARVS